MQDPASELQRIPLLRTRVNMRARIRQGRLGTSGAGFLRVRGGMLVADHPEGLLVDLFGGYHVGHPLDQAGDVRPASLFVFLVLPEGHRRGVAAGAVDKPVTMAEAWAHGYGASVNLLEDRYALLHLLWPNFYAYHPCEHDTSPKETVSPSPGESITLRSSTAMTPLLTAPGAVSCYAPP